jgi:hypothetical protein
MGMTEEELKMCECGHRQWVHKKIYKAKLGYQDIVICEMAGCPCNRFVESREKANA